MEYVENRETAYYVRGTRVSLDSVIYAFLRGDSPEEIAESFPALNLEQVYGAITYYLANREAVDRYLEAGRASFQRMREDSRRRNPRLYAKLESARKAASDLSA